MPSRVARRADLGLRRADRSSASWRRKSPSASCARSGRRSVSSSPVGIRVAHVPSPPRRSSASWSKEPGVDAGPLGDLASTGRRRWSARLIWKIRSGVGRAERGLTLAESTRRASRSAAAVAPVTQPIRSISRPRSPFWNASLKVRPMAMTSPTDFICVVSVGSAVGNFSKANRGHLDHDVVEHRLERGGGGLGDVVGQLVEPVAHGQLGPDPGDRKAGGLGRERRGARDPRIHLDDQLLAGGGVDGELDVASARRDADFADDGERASRIRWYSRSVSVIAGRHRDRVAGVDPHRIEILDRADDHHVVGAVAHDLELELLPADDALLDEHRADRRELEPARDQRLELLAVVGDAAARCRRG